MFNFKSEYIPTSNETGKKPLFLKSVCLSSYFVLVLIKKNKYNFFCFSYFSFKLCWIPLNAISERQFNRGCDAIQRDWRSLFGANIGKYYLLKIENK